MASERVGFTWLFPTKFIYFPHFSRSMLETSECDEKGRLVLPREIRDEFGTRFVVIKVLGKVVLLPVPKDPVKRLGELGRKAGINRYSLKQLKCMIREEALKQAYVRRH